MLDRRVSESITVYRNTSRRSVLLSHDLKIDGLDPRAEFR
jgi:hypothetical protein